MGLANQLYNIKTLLNMQYKFRAWIEAIKVMLYNVDVYANGTIGITYANLPTVDFNPYYIDWDNSCIRESATDNHIMNILTGDEYIWFESGFELMQHIDKKDKNGEDIYDGDIISGKDTTNAPSINPIDLKPLRYKISFSSNGYYFSNVEYCGSYQSHPLQSLLNCEWEVVGNIYQTKGGA